MHPCSTYTFDTTRTTLKFYYYICACLCYILSTYSDPVPTRGVQSNITLEDSGDIFESRASSAVTMCPSPHTPGPAGKETPVVRTHVSIFVPLFNPLLNHDLMEAGIRASVDALSRDGTDMRGDAQNPKSFQAPRM